MKKIILLLAMTLCTSSIFAQVDVITKHNGEIVNGKVVRVDEYVVVYKYDGEDAENSIGKYAIEKIVYGKSGRVQEVTEKIVVNGENDWDKVIILEDKSYIAGLKKVGEIKGKTAFINMHTGNTGDSKADKKLKMEAAKLGCQFIFMTADKDINESGANGVSFGAVQSIRKGIAYKY
jgi:sRNA-binding regulator protein Hfq